MAKCHRNNVGSLFLDQHQHHHRHSSSGGNFKLWSAFSGAAFRRKLIDTMRCGISRQRHELDSELSTESDSAPSITSESKRKSGSAKLSEILKVSLDEVASVVAETETEKEKEKEKDKTKRKVEVFEELQAVVKRLQFEEGVKQIEAALDVRRLAKEDSEARETLAMLGSIPPLIGMLDSLDLDVQIASLYALLNLGIGNDENKGAIVTAGVVHKMLRLMDSSNTFVCEAMVANFLALSALDSNKLIIGTSGAIPFLLKILKTDQSSSQAKQDSLRAIYNLSILPSNIVQILETDLVLFLLNSVGDMEVSERVLSILCNVVYIPEGRKSISNVRDSISILVDVLNWNDSPKCQEKATYILMVMAHKAYGDRQAMIEAGITSVLLELTLLGTTLAQKRASRILEVLRVDKGKQVSESYKGGLGGGGGGGGGGAVSAPIYGSTSSSNGLSGGLKQEEEEEDLMMSEEKRAVKQLVQQSLQNNMRRIVKRANFPQDFVPSEHFKALTTTSTSKSVPF